MDYDMIFLFGVSAFLALAIIFITLICRKKIKRCEMQAVTDPVTGSLNRAGLIHAARKHIRKEKSKHSLVLMDVRNFDQIRQTFGSIDGDRVLNYLYKILQSSLSKSEPIARLSKGTFCFLLKTRQEDAIKACLNQIYLKANSFNDSVSVPYMLSVCFAVCSEGSDASQMLERAAELLEAPGNEPLCRFYKQTNDEAPIRKWELAQQFERALCSGDLSIYLQPKVRLTDKRIAGAEAFIRWRHPIRGLLTPEMFMPAISEYGLSYKADRFLLDSVCQRISGWKKEGKTLCPISMNISRGSLEKENFIPDYVSLCNSYGVSPSLIEFELDEDIFSTASEKILKAIPDLRAAGFRCSLDHFGGSHIPLHLLRDMEVDAVKLDGRFFFSSNNSLRNRFTIEAILKMASQMQISSIAEGIENESQVKYLYQAACDMVQGVYYFRPMPVDEFQRTAYTNGDLRYIGSTEPAAERESALKNRSNNKNIIMFSLIPGEDRIEFSDIFSPVQEGQMTLNNASSLFFHSPLIHENDRKDFSHLLERSKREEGWVENALRFYTLSGHYEWLEVYLHREYAPLSGSNVVSGTLINMAGWKNEVDRWKEKANRDALTGLYNREYFELATDGIVRDGDTSTGAMIFIDIDDFKHVNDTLGHVVGDDVICWVAKRILGEFRHTDIVARYGGDEFVVFANGISRINLEKRLANLCSLFCFPYRSNDIEYHISCSVGGAMFPEDGTSYGELLNHADAALYMAKRAGKNRFVLYEPGMDNEVQSD